MNLNKNLIIYIIGFSDIRRKRKERIKLKSDHTIYYQGLKDKSQRGVDFIVHKKNNHKLHQM